MRIDCEGCSQEFTLTGTLERQHPNGVHETYFVCPHPDCGHKQTAALMTDEGKRLQAQINELWKKFRRSPSTAERQALQNRIESLRDNLSMDMADARQKMQE